MSRGLAALLSVVMTLLLLILGFASLLLLTTAGARWLADWAMELEPRLTLTIDSGAIASGLVVSNLSWRDEAIDLSAIGAELDWSPGCLLAARVCLDRLALSGLQISVQPTASESESQLPAADVRLPVPVQLQLLQLNDARLTLPDAEIALRRLQTSGHFSGNTLTLEWLRAAGFDVTLAATAEPAPAAPVPTEDRPVRLPEIDLPFDLVVQNLLLEDADLQRADERFSIDTLAVSAALHGSQLVIQRVELAAEGLEAELAGRITLAGGYPLSLRLSADLATPDLPAPLRLSAGLEGSLEQLAVTAELVSPVALRAEAALQPLVAGLPFALTARWQQLAYPFAGAAVVLLRDGELKVTGDLVAYQGTLATLVEGEQLPTGDWHLRFAGDSDQLRIAQLDAATLDGTLKADGLLRWRGGLRWQARLIAQDLNPGVHWHDYPARLGGELEVHGQVEDNGVAFAATTPGIVGELRGYPLALYGTVSKSTDDSWSFDGLKLTSGRNRLEVAGRLEQSWAVQGGFELPEPGILLPELAGSASGRFTVRGALAEPDVSLEAQGRRLRYQDRRLAEIGLRLELRQLALEHSSLRWAASGLQLGEQRFGRIQGVLAGSRAGHELTLRAENGDYGGQLRLRGGLDDQLDWTGELLSATLKLPPRQQWTLSEPVALRWQQERSELFVAVHCWRQRDASLCLDQNAVLGQSGGVRLTLSGFRTNWLAAWLPEGLRWQASLNGRASASWQPDMPPSARVELSSNGGTILLEQEDADPLELVYQRLAAQLALERNMLDASLELASQRLGAGHVLVRTRLDSEPLPLEGEVALDGLQIGLLRAFLPDIQTLNGTVGANGLLTGTLQDPQFIGNFRLANGELAAANLPMTLNDIQLRADVSGSEAQLDGSFRSGDGSGRIAGAAGWGAETWRLNLAVDGEQLRFFYEPVADLQVSPNLKIQVEPQRVGVVGKVFVPRGKITLKELPEGAVAVSSDVVVINRAGTIAEERVPAAEWRVTTDIELALGNAVQIEGYGLEGRLAGNLRLRQRPGGVPEAIGELSVVDGRYQAYGQNLEIRQGQLLFSGPLKEPNLNVEAVRRADSVVAGLRIEGEPKQPQVTLFSEPGLPQEEILSYLIRGRPLGTEGVGSDQLLAQAAVSLGVFGGKGFASSLARELGVKDFEVGTAGEGQETQVELSGYITPDLLVRYGIGVFEPVNTLTLRYRISKSFFVEAVSGLESALDFFYEFEF